jgi:thiol:disulfide interchange protein DsbA
MLNRIIITLSLLLGSQAILAQDQYEEGKHYFKIDQPPGQVATGEVELIEAFSYMCSHCNTFDPYMEAWKKRKPEYATLRRLPVVFGRGNWELMARGYTTAEVMGIANESHVAMMDSIWKQGKVYRNVEDLGDFYAGFGVSKEDFISNYSSFAVDSMMRKGQRDVAQFGVSGTPTLIIDGKYRVQSSKDVPGFDSMLAVANYLIEKEHAAATE